MNKYAAALRITDPDNISKHLRSLTDDEILRFMMALAAAAHKRELIDLLEGHFGGSPGPDGVNRSLTSLLRLAAIPDCGHNYSQAKIAYDWRAASTC